MAGKYPDFRRRVRARLYQKQRGLCYYCQEPMLLAKGPDDARLSPRFATVDHIIPASKGGGFNKENTVGACFQCNQERGDKDARMFMLEKQGML